MNLLLLSTLFLLTQTSQTFTTSIQTRTIKTPSPLFQSKQQLEPEPEPYSCSHHYQEKEKEQQEKSIHNRRRFMKQMVQTSALAGWMTMTFSPQNANAKSDCFKDCLNECKLIAPKDPNYCIENCKEYCEQDDRKDGLSGSVSSEGGEVGILGSGTVVKSEDKPPSISLPGLDFTSASGRKLIGY